MLVAMGLLGDGERSRRWNGCCGSRRVRNNYLKSEGPRSKPADAIMVAPATYNTISKLALSITYALGVLAEAIGLWLPAIVMPFLNSALASRMSLARTIEQLRSERVAVYFRPGTIERHGPDRATPHDYHGQPSSIR